MAPLGEATPQVHRQGGEQVAFRVGLGERALPEVAEVRVRQQRHDRRHDPQQAVVDGEQLVTFQREAGELAAPRRSCLSSTARRPSVAASIRAP